MSSESELELSILIPCLNEENNVQGVLASASEAAKSAGISFEILVIDDGSTDGTYRKACEFRDLHPEVSITIHKNERNRGFGAVFFQGARLVRGKYYRICCGDDVESVDTLKRIFGYIGKADILSPYHPVDPGRPIGRRILSKTYTELVNLISGNRLQYYNGCPVVLRKDVLKWKDHTDGFAFQAELITRLLANGATIFEFPVDTTERRTGTSKAITSKNLISTGKVMTEILLRRLKKRPH